MSNITTLLPRCEENALIVLGITLGVLFIGTAVIVVVRYLSWRQRSNYDDDDDSIHELIRSRQIRWFPKKAEIILTGKPIAGKILILVRSALYTICSIIYIWNTYRYRTYTCLSVHAQPQYMVELVCNLIFFFIFTLKITASKDLLRTWISVDSVIDHFTVLPVMLALIFGYYQYNFGFLYFTKLVDITEAIVLLNFVHHERSIRKLKLISKLFAAWFTFAGLILLLERYGNFWESSRKTRDLQYFDCVYFLLVTVATVGYGDIVCTSYLGRLVIIVVIITALISITTHMSELYDLFRCTKQYTGSFNTEYHPRHVVVCGSISYDSVSIFLDAFVNADLGRYDKNIMVVFLSENDPDLRMKALLRRESTNATFLRGDATSQKDLRRAKIRAAEAVIVLGNMKSARPAEDDWENIMRVVSIKNLYPHCRVVCVLTLMENKALMSNIPGWNEDRTGEGDRAICMSQLKLGLMSLNCVSPGISTLLSNLVVSVSVPMGAAKQKKIPRWVRNYFEGTRYRLYSVKLSPTFDQMFFQNLVSIAMKHLHVLVLAVQIFSSIDGTEQIIINPGTRLRINSRQMRAVVLAENFISAQHLRVYCVSCQADRSSHHFEVPFHICRHNSSTPGFSGTECSSEKPHAPPLIKQLFHPFRLHWFNFKQNVLHYQRTKPSPSVCLRRASRKIRPSFKRSIPFATGVQITGVDIMRDTTGLFYWVADREFSSACLSLNDMLDCVLSDHILVCLTKKPGDSRLGLASFVMPLRSTQIPMEELRPIVFLCDSTVVKGEWYSLKNFPQIYILSGSPLSRAFLRAAGVETCFACVVLSCSDELPEKPSLMSDKECILCTLNIRRMIAEAEEQDMDRGPVKQPLVITELSEQKSNTLISVTEEYRSKSGYIPFSPLLAAGNMFVSPLLNDLASTVFFDPAILIFLETVILGGPSQEVEKVFAEDSGFYPGLRGQTITSIPFPGFERRVENRSSNEEQDGSSEASTTNSVFGDNINNCNDGKLKVRFSPDPTQNMIPSKPTSPSSSPVVNPRFTVSKTVINEIPRPPNPLNRHSSLTEESLDTGNDLVKTKTTRQQILENRFTITDPRLERLKQAHSDSWRPLSTNSFLSYTTETGGSVKVRLSRLRLLPLSDLGSTLNRILLQKSETLTFGRMFDLVLHDNGTICIGLYRRVEDGLDEDSDRTEDGIRDMEIEIERYVYTFPKEDTPIFPNDLVYCFTAVTEIREADR